MKMKYKLISLLLFLFLTACNSDVISKNSNGFRVLDVIDGDTFTIDDEYRSRIRMLGINTPEILTEAGPGEPFANKAKDYLAALIENKTVRFEYGNEKFDQYGRILAYVFKDDELVNEKILEMGLGRSFIFKEQIKYNQQLLKAESQAKKARKGIWGNPKSFEYPKDNNQFVIKPISARRYLDQKVVVQGKVSDTKVNKKVVVLKMDDDLDIVIFKDNLESFKHFKIKPEDYFLGQLVEVIGKVSVYRGRTQIKVYHPISIRKI